MSGFFNPLAVGQMTPAVQAMFAPKRSSTGKRRKRAGTSARSNSGGKRRKKAAAAKSGAKRLTKGSAAAKAWGRKMKALRKKR